MSPVFDVVHGLSAALFVGLATAGALIRWRLHGLAFYAPGDERIYTEQARQVSEGGLEAYRKLVREYFRHPRNWTFPSPARYGWIWLCADVMRCGAPAEPRTLAAISGLAGVAVHALMMAIAYELGGQGAMLCAGALGLVAPLGLHLGRRALQDSLVCALTLLALWAVIAGGPVWVLGPALFALLAVKEASLLAWPALLAVGLMRGTDIVGFFVQPILYLLGLWLLSGAGWRVIPAYARAISAGQRSDYSRRFQAGPAHRALVDLVAVSPAAMVLIVAGPWVPVELAVFVSLLLAAHAIAPVQNVRFIASADVAVRVIGAIGLSLLPPIVQLLLVPIVVAADWMIFRRVFYRSGVFDPVTFNVLRAQGAIP